MRFRFLGDVDCPDWLLAEIYNLSQMPSTKMKSLGLMVVKSIIDEDLDEEKLKKFSKDSDLAYNGVKAVFAALDKIFSSSARNAVSPADLNSELQQLGLPKEHSGIISRLHTDNCTEIAVKLTGQSLRLSKLRSVEVKPAENSLPFVKIAFKMKNLGDEEKETVINIPRNELEELITDLKSVKTMMEQVLN